MKGFIKLLVSVIVCQLAGAIGSIFTASSVKTWYAVINKPSFTPPNWLFGPVWIFLFLLMGISLFLVWSHPSAARGH
jgi:tryptophan-rich sensory protein